jgi:hypothetical protein
MRGGAADSIDLEALLDMEASLRTASSPRMPESPAQPLMLADASPVGALTAPFPLRPDTQTAAQGASVHSREGGNPGTGRCKPVSALDPRLREDDSLPLPNIPSTPEALASKLAQAEGVAANTNLAITPALNRLKDKLRDAAPATKAPKPSTVRTYVLVARAAKSLPDAAAFLARLKNPQPPASAQVQVAQAGDAPAPASAFDRLYYLAGPGKSPAVADLIVANELLKACNYQGALSAFARNHWPLSFGMGGRNRRNTHGGSQQCPTATQ